MTILRLFRAVALCVACLSAGAVTAGTITITLDDVVVGTCGTSWAEAGVEMWFSETTSEDLTYPYCLVVADADMAPSYEGVYIYPARLVVNLANVEGVESVEVDVYETHFAGSTRAFLYGDGSMVASMYSFREDHQTLTVSAGGNAVDSFAVSAHESYVFEIRIIGDGVTGNEPSTFGAVKALYR